MQTRKWKHIFHIKLGTYPWEGSPSCTIPCPYFWLYNSPLSFFCVLRESSSLHMLLHLWCHEPSSVSKGCLLSFLLLPQILNPPPLLSRSLPPCSAPLVGHASSEHHRQCPASVMTTCPSGFTFSSSPGWSPLSKRSSWLNLSGSHTHDLLLTLLYLVFGSNLCHLFFLPCWPRRSSHPSPALPVPSYHHTYVSNAKICPSVSVCVTSSVLHTIITLPL